MKVKECLNFNKVYKDGYGLEIECEGAHLGISNNDFWTVHEDHSLRPNPQCCEYVLNGPMSYKDTLAAVSWLNNEHTENGTKFNWSFRCSTHVHVNMQNKKITDLFKTVYIYYLFENLLTKWSGEEREGNRFCLRLQDSYRIVEQLDRIFTTNLKDIREDNIRYAALNLGSLRKYGSIEFRSLNGTTNYARIKSWLDFINCIVNAAERYGDVLDILNALRESPEKLADDVFGELFNELKFDGWEREVVYNSSLSIGLVDIYKKVKGHEEDYAALLQQREQELKAAEAKPERKKPAPRKKPVQAEAPPPVGELGDVVREVQVPWDEFEQFAQQARERVQGVQQAPRAPALDAGPFQRWLAAVHRAQGRRNPDDQ